MLADEWGVAADVWSVTSWNELRRDGGRDGAVEPHPPRRGAALPVRHPTLHGAPGPVVAVSDYMRAVQDQIAPWVHQPWTSLGTDGFGFADTRAAARRYFRVDAESIVVATLRASLGTDTTTQGRWRGLRSLRLGDPTAVAGVRKRAPRPKRPSFWRQGGNETGFAEIAMLLTTSQ